ncbi:Hpt domain-containing protein [Pedobacter deserti]|uniref:Hpt domain-containing protein n=1 Tax=Pedobacter deserti TaxID=2817382 RepID=UPI00210B1A26|nr:Hpt domain-containing protein [Pedobacter sp. SYSU D00382]
MIDAQKNNEPLDLSYLREMAGDSPEFIIEMIDLFKQQTPAYIEELQSAVAAKDWSRVAASAHKIKPTFTYVGRADAKTYMQWIETSAKEGSDLDRLPAAIQEISAFTEILYVQLDQARSEMQRQL